MGNGGGTAGADVDVDVAVALTVAAVVVAEADDEEVGGRGGKGGGGGTCLDVEDRDVDREEIDGGDGMSEDVEERVGFVCVASISSEGRFCRGMDVWRGLQGITMVCCDVVCVYPHLKTRESDFTRFHATISLGASASNGSSASTIGLRSGTRSSCSLSNTCPRAGWSPQQASTPTCNCACMRTRAPSSEMILGTRAAVLGNNEGERRGNVGCVYGTRSRKAVCVCCAR